MAKNIKPVLLKPSFWLTSDLTNSRIGKRETEKGGAREKMIIIKKVERGVGSGASLRPIGISI